MRKHGSDLLKKNRFLGLGLALVLIIVLLAAAMVILFEQEKPRITVLNDVSRCGPELTVRFTVADQQRGLREIALHFVQQVKVEGKGPQTREVRVMRKEFPRQGYLLNIGPKQVEETISINIPDLGFKEGKALLRFTAQDFSLWGWAAGNRTTLEVPVDIDITPPRVVVVDAPRDIRPGGSGVVIYRINETPATHGVSINGRFLPGYPLNPESKGLFAALIGLPHDTAAISKAVVIATDQVGNQGRASFGMNLRKARQRFSRIEISDGFLNRKLPEFAEAYPQMTGSPAQQFIFVNNEVRLENAKRIREICSQSAEQRLWQGSFKQMARSKKTAGFADSRDYFYKGKKIDHQVHLGIDLASTRRDQVKAANRGRVVFADYLGIYGNTVILDHGQGLASLYAHLSRIKVEPDTLVDQDAVLGLSGTTGMAGGDHLHFSILVNGVFVNPLEWWDRHWLQLHILDPLSGN